VITGASGAVGADGVTGSEDADGEEAPTEFTAVTTNRYETELVKPVTVADVAVPGAEAVPPTGTEVTR